MKSYAEQHDEKLKVAKAMRIYGGSFVQALSECIIRADQHNFQKIKNTWPEIWEQYLEISEATQ